MQALMPSPIYLVFALVFGYLGFREARGCAVSKGRPPWGVAPAVWSLALGASLFFGGVLLIIARRTTKPVAPAPRRLPGPPPQDQGLVRLGTDVLPRW